MGKNTPQKETLDIWWRPAVLIFFQLSIWIVVPIVIALYLGKWLDTKYGTEPWLFLGSVGIAFIASTIGIIKESFRAMKVMETIGKDSNIKRSLICFRHEIGDYPIDQPQADEPRAQGK